MNRFAATIILLAVTFVSCYKAEVIPFRKVSKPPKGCNASSFYGQSYAEEGDPFHGFTKQYDSEGRVTEVVAPMFSLVLADSIRMRLVYYDHEVKFVNNANPADTVLTAVFNNQGRLIRLTGNSAYEFARTEYN